MKSVSFLFCFIFLFIQCGSDERTVENVDLSSKNHSNKSQSSEKIALQSGSYGDLQVAYDGKQVTGYYNLVTGNGQFACTFYFIGKTDGKKGQIPIEWHFPGDKERNTGTLTIEEGKIQLKVEGNPGGQCMPELMTEGEQLSLLHANNWKSIRVVKSAKAKIYEEADESLDSGMHYKKGDVLCVLEE